MNPQSSNAKLTCLLASLTVLFMVLPAHAQVTSISGKVTDQAGAVVPGVTVTLTSSTGADRTDVSNEVGAYRFLQLAPGIYRIKAELAGFKTAVKEGLDLLVDTPNTLNLNLEVGQITETITVEAGALKLNAQDATLGSAINSMQIRELPLESRNVANLLSIQAAVTPDGYVSGARSDQSNLTLDGIDVNDNQDGTAFSTVIRVNPDSVQEFRVTTATPNATQGRSSGGQVSLITKTGTNEWHGSLYWFFRTTGGTANDFFNNRDGLPRPELRRDLYGGSVGGPIVKDRAFFFYNYEGRRDDKETSILSPVPTASLGRGEVKYLNDTGGITTLTAADVNRIFPAVGVNPIALQVLADAAARYPVNDSGEGDGLNSGGYRFNAPLPVNQKAHTATLSFNVTRDGRHQLLLRGNYQNDKDKGAPAFPDTPSTDFWSHPIGYTVQHTWTVTPKMVNTFRFGVTRLANTNQGDTSGNDVLFRFIYYPTNETYTTSRVNPSYNFIDDISWVKGNHTWQFGTNMRIIRNTRNALNHSFDSGSMNPSYYEASGDILTEPLTDFAGSVQGIQGALTSVIGRLTEYSGNFNFGQDLNPTTLGAAVGRTFATEEYEFYAQDSWRVKRDLTLTLGLRYSLNSPVYEKDGFQTRPTASLSDYFDKRVAGALQGQPYNDPLVVDLSGPHWNKPGFYPMDKNDWAPRAGFAWNPAFQNGLLRKIFGTGQKSVFRGGYAMAYDRVGSRLAVDFDLNNTLGFSSTQTIAANTYNVTDNPGPLFTGLGMPIRDLPNLSIPGKLEFPLQTPSDEDPRIEISLDDKIQSPVNHSWNLSWGREFKGGLTMEMSYIGRAGRNLLASRDILQPNNLVDPKSGVDWYTAMKGLIGYRNASAPISSIPGIPYFENLFPDLAGTYTVLGQPVDLTASQAAYRRIGRRSVGGRNTVDYTTVQLLWNDGYGYGDQLFYQPQYASLASKSTFAYSNYHAGAFSLRQRLSALSLDFNYTFSKSLDNASGLERGDFYGAADFVTNSLRPDDNYALSGFDITHMVNASALWQLPFGRGKMLCNSAGPVANAIVGGWELTSIFRWNSGLPEGAPFDGQVWATNWNSQSWGTRIRSIGESPTKSGDHPNFFSDPVFAYQSFRNALPGETGERNTFRKPTYVAVDLGLAKSYKLPWAEGHRVQFRWEVFNATNTQRLAGPNRTRSGFGLATDPWDNGVPAPEFGRINSIQGNPRVMQWAVRYDF